MARYGGDYRGGYDRDFGRWNPYGQIGGMRSDGGSGNDWRDFPGEEGWFGEGYAGMPNDGYGSDFRDRWGRGKRAWSDVSPGYQGDFGRRPGPGGFPGGRGYGAEFGGRRGYGDYGYGGYGSDFRAGGPQRGYGQADFAAGGYGGRSGYDAWNEGYPGRESGYGQGWREQRGGRQRERTMRASELMTSNPEAVTPDAPISEVARKMRDLGVGIIPVVESEENLRLKGVITDRDIAVRAIAEGRDGETKVSECMTESVRTVNKNDGIHEVMRLMREDQLRRVPVTDRDGRLVGIIAQADLAVDLGSGNERLQRQVSSTIERISEPAEPSRDKPAMAASGRSGSSGSESRASAGKRSGRSSRSGNRKNEEEDR